MTVLFSGVKVFIPRFLVNCSNCVYIFQSERYKDLVELCGADFFVFYKVDKVLEFVIIGHLGCDWRSSVFLRFSMLSPVIGMQLIATHSCFWIPFQLFIPALKRLCQSVMSDRSCKGVHVHYDSAAIPKA